MLDTEETDNISDPGNPSEDDNVLVMTWTAPQMN